MEEQSTNLSLASKILPVQYSDCHLIFSLTMLLVCYLVWYGYCSCSCPFRFDYCNVLHVGLHLKTAWKSQLVQNIAVHMSMGVSQFYRVTLILRALHWRYWWFSKLSSKCWGLLLQPCMICIQGI